MQVLSPRISICTPNLNNLQFLPEWLASVRDQSYARWELIIVDGGSNDGAWEYLFKHSKTEPRMRLYQEPANGIYDGLNSCIRLARGEYIYVSPGDDIIAPNCLERLVAALDGRPDCGLAHCRLQAFGEGSVELNSWWQGSSLFALSSGELLDSAHIRLAPMDGLLHLYGETVYTSLTQLLIRRSLFDNIGFFDDRWGSIGDFHWGMRAGLVTNTVHVPHTWGGWRLHDMQATRTTGLDPSGHRTKIEEMIDDALATCWPRLTPQFQHSLRNGMRHYFINRIRLLNALRHRHTRMARTAFLSKELLHGSSAALSYTLAALARNSETWNSRQRVMARWLRFLRVGRHIVPID
jgi:glycosyltransferase involved in cell wall biosynthesis